MDLRLVPHAEPTADERAALDALLGPAASGWEGGARKTGHEGNTAAGGHEARARRHLLLPALWALQERTGWISPGGLNEVCRRLNVPPADAYGVASFYALLALEPQPRRVVHVCDDVACRCHGAESLAAQLEERFGPEGAPSGDGSATWLRSPCLGRCDTAPAALVSEAGDPPLERGQAPTSVADVLALLGGPLLGPVVLLGGCLRLLVEVLDLFLDLLDARPGFRGRRRVGRLREQSHRGESGCGEGRGPHAHGAAGCPRFAVRRHEGDSFRRPPTGLAVGFGRVLRKVCPTVSVP